MSAYQKLLTKSNYLLGLQCSKLLHVQLYNKSRIPKPDEGAMHRFKTGDETEEMAKTLFPGGIDLRRDDFLENLKISEEYLEKRVPLFEPAFKFEQLYSRGDVLVPVGENEWDIVEMKSATKVKEVNLHDVSFQKYVYELCGLNIRKCFLMYINKDYVRQGEIEPEKLFIQTDITEEVKNIGDGIEERISKMLEIANNIEEPSYEIGSHCTSPYSCSLRWECWAELPEGNILQYYRDEEFQCFDLGEYGRIKIRKIPDFYNGTFNPFQRQMLAKNEGKGFEKRILNDFLSSLEYPLYYLDVGTINPAVPKYDGMQPYKKIPFQFSLHIQESENSKIEHVSFLADKVYDPRFLFLKLLKDTIKSKGTVIVYDKNNETSLLKNLAWNFRNFKPWVDSVLPRIKDIWEVLQNFHYYDIEGENHSKIKYLVPRLTNLKHSDIEQIEGEDRGLEFEKITYGEGIDNGELMEARKKLREKAKKETLDLIEIVRIFRNIAKS